MKTYEEWKTEVDQKVDDAIAAMKQVKAVFEEIDKVDTKGVSPTDVHAFAIAASLKMSKAAEEV